MTPQCHPGPQSAIAEIIYKIDLPAESRETCGSLLRGYWTGLRVGLPVPAGCLSRRIPEPADRQRARRRLPGILNTNRRTALQYPREQTGMRFDRADRSEERRVGRECRS